MKHLATAVLLLLATSPASAMCYQGRGVPGALDYLVCLHNEQLEDLERHSRIINDHARRIDDANKEINELQWEVADLIKKLNETSTEAARLKIRVEELEARTDN